MTAVLVPLFFFPGSSQVASAPASQAEQEDGKEVLSAAEDETEGTVYFVLEESSGYMEPALHFLAVAHTIISFCCIIGYYCLKVHRLQCPLLYPDNKLYLVYRVCFKASELIAHPALQYQFILALNLQTLIKGDLRLPP